MRTLSARYFPNLAVSAFLVLAFVAASCGTATPRTAPFRDRPDSTHAGNLAGPFTGRVVDATSKEPIAGAMVYATWSYQTGVGASQATGFREAVTSTDRHGTYRIPAVTDPPPGRLVDAHLVIYKRDYTAYRSDRRYSDFGPRLDFAQRNNQVFLERWQPGQFHSRHLRYIGGGSALKTLTAWEIDEANDELSLDADAPSAIPSPSERRIDASQLLKEEDIKAITKYSGTFETGPLRDDNGTASYSSQHFKATGKTEAYDLALRLWQLPPTLAVERFNELLSALPGATEHDGPGDRGFVTSEEGIQGYGFLVKEPSILVLITCGKSQCTSTDQILALASTVLNNIQATPDRTETSETTEKQP